MFKKILVIALLFLPLGIFAQESIKIAYVNTSEVMPFMPEFTAMQAELEKYATQVEEELNLMQDEMTKKFAAFQQQQDTLTESIKLRRMQDMNDLRDRAETYRQEADQEYAKKQQDLFVPIQQKLLDAIKSVGEANGYTYIMQEQGFLYISPNAINATSLIKQKLGLQ